MLLLIPYRADVPVDHRPWGTLGLIAFTIGVAVVLGFPDRPTGEGPFINALVLAFGTLNPLQWVTSVFVHLDWVHVLVNMLFLWWFGLAVEGLIGWRRFVPLYVATGALAGGVTQILMLGADGGGAAGASGAIFGMMAVAALWAPRNTFSSFILFFVFVRWTEISVLGLAMIFVVLELLSALLIRFSMSSEVMHLLGAGSGLVIGVWMLRKDWVDSGGWDWFSLRRGRRVTRPGVAAPAPPGPTPTPTAAAQALVRVREALDRGAATGADSAYRAALAAEPAFALPRAELWRLIGSLERAGACDAAIDRSEEFLKTYPDDVAARLQLATMLLRAKRPRRALEHLATMHEAPLTLSQQEALAALEAEARGSAKSPGLELE
jgi:membrane associated rhomboid family serine protease